MPATPPTKHRNDAEAEPITRRPENTPRDRRRPGRLEQVSPALIDLLRSYPGADAMPGENRKAQTARDLDDSSLGAARGILSAAVVGLLLWGGLFWIVKSWLIGYVLP